MKLCFFVSPLRFKYRWAMTCHWGTYFLATFQIRINAVAHLVSLLIASAIAFGETPFLASADWRSRAFAMSSGDDGVAPITFTWFELETWLSTFGFILVPFQSAMPLPAPMEKGWPRWGHSAGFCLWRLGSCHLLGKGKYLNLMPYCIRSCVQGYSSGHGRTFVDFKLWVAF